MRNVRERNERQGERDERGGGDIGDSKDNYFTLQCMVVLFVLLFPFPSSFSVQSSLANGSFTRQTEVWLIDFLRSLEGLLVTVEK